MLILSEEPLLPASAEPLSLPPFILVDSSMEEELKEKDVDTGDEQCEQSAVGEDRLGTITGQGWDDAGDLHQDEEHDSYLWDDDIEDWE